MSPNVLFRFSATARTGLSNAQREAQLEQSPAIEVRHLLLGLAQLPVRDSTAAHVLNGLGITAEKLRTGDGDPAVAAGTPELGDSVKKSLERAAAIARQRRDQKLASAHLLAGSLKDADVIQQMQELGVTTERISAALNSLDDWTNEP